MAVLVGQAGSILGADGRLEGVLAVEANHGAALLWFPLGPGIGTSALGYAPGVEGRFAARVGVLPATEAGKDQSGPGLIATRGFQLSPGTLDLRLVPVKHPARQVAWWSVPRGDSECRGDPLPAGVDVATLQARFGLAAGMGTGFLPHRPGANPIPLALAGTAGEMLLGLGGEPQDMADGDGSLWRVPSALLAVQGGMGYEFRLAEAWPGGTGIIHYRLVAIRRPDIQPVLFHYGENGVDFEAVWEDQKVRVFLDGVAAIPPVLALDDSISGLPGEAWRNTLARVRVVYEGCLEPRSFTVTALARPEFVRPDGCFSGGFRTMGGSGDFLPDAFRRHLQVTVLRREGGDGDQIAFRYGQGEAVVAPGGGTFAATVLEEIRLQGRTIHLAWTTMPSLSGADGTHARTWTYGVKQVRDVVQPGAGPQQHSVRLLRPARDIVTEGLDGTGLRDMAQGLVGMSWTGSGLEAVSEAGNTRYSANNPAWVLLAGRLRGANPFLGGKNHAPFRLLGGGLIGSSSGVSNSAQPAGYGESRDSSGGSLAGSLASVGASSYGSGGKLDQDKGHPESPGAVSPPWSQHGPAWAARVLAGGPFETAEEAGLAGQQSAGIDAGMYDAAAEASDDDDQPAGDGDDAGMYPSEAEQSDDDDDQSTIDGEDAGGSISADEQSDDDDDLSTGEGDDASRHITTAQQSGDAEDLADADQGQATSEAQDLAEVPTGPDPNPTVEVLVPKAGLTPFWFDSFTVSWGAEKDRDSPLPTPGSPSFLQHFEGEGFPLDNPSPRFQPKEVPPLPVPGNSEPYSKPSTKAVAMAITGVPGMSGSRARHSGAAFYSVPSKGDRGNSGTAEATGGGGRRSVHFKSGRPKVSQAPGGSAQVAPVLPMMSCHGRSDSLENKGQVKTFRCIEASYPDPARRQVPIICAEDGSLRFDTGSIFGGPLPIVRAVEGHGKVITQGDRADAVHRWINEAADRGTFDNTRGVQDPAGFQAFLQEFDPSKMRFEDYQERYQDFLAGHMPGRLIGEGLFNWGLLPASLFQTQSRMEKPGVPVSGIPDRMVDKLLAIVDKPYNETGISVAARALEKHGERPGGTFGKLTGSVGFKNKVASEFVKMILTSPDVIRAELTRGGFEYRISNGQGIRFNADGSFSGILDPKR